MRLPSFLLPGQKFEDFGFDAQGARSCGCAKCGGTFVSQDPITCGPADVQEFAEGEPVPDLLCYLCPSCFVTLEITKLVKKGFSPVKAEQVMRKAEPQVYKDLDSLAGLLKSVS